MHESTFSNPKVYLADMFHPDLLTGLAQKGFACVQGKPVIDAADAVDIENCHVVVISTKSKITKEVIDAMASIKLIVRGGSGMDNIDTEYAEQKGIICINTPEGNRDSVAEHAVGMMLALLHNFKAQREVELGIWQPYTNRPIELRNKTVAIVGYGNTGMALASLLTVFGCKIIAYDKYKKGFGTKHVMECDWNEIYEQADILSLHVPLTSETEHLINETSLYKFKKRVFLINTSRGEVVDTMTLLNTLKNGKIAGAGLDVAEGENCFKESVLFSFFQNQNAGQISFNNTINLIVTPHIAGKSIESQALIAACVVDKISTWHNNILSN